MNSNHALCSSPEWAEHLGTEVLSPLLAEIDLGREMLEIGPGPGAATKWLRDKVKRLAVLEIDDEAARALEETYAGSNVEVLRGDASAIDLDEASFDSVGTFTMLHHVPTLALQDRVLAEAFRVLRPGGVLVCSDSLASTGLHEFHDGDTYNPIEPSSLLPRLQTLGFRNITIQVNYDLRFAAHKPTLESDEDESCRR